MITRYFVDHVTALICIVALMFEKCKMCEPLYVKPSKYGVIPSCNGTIIQSLSGFFDDTFEIQVLKEPKYGIFSHLYRQFTPIIRRFSHIDM